MGCCLSFGVRRLYRCHQACSASLFLKEIQAVLTPIQRHSMGISDKLARQASRAANPLNLKPTRHLVACRGEREPCDRPPSPG